MKHLQHALGRKAAGWTLIATVAMAATAALAAAPESVPASMPASAPSAPQTAPAPIAAPAAPAAEGGVRFTDLPADDVAAT
ncbi:dihydrolipoamide acetyltransferase, partial [Caulobacter sp. 17J65-9]|nr:dihydrolipoamide acetyltransferase [Caulobacter sp. 17J65-9]